MELSVDGDNNKYELYWNNNAGFYGSFTTGNVYEIMFNWLNDKNFNVENETLTALSSTAEITTNTIYLFNLNWGGHPEQYISARIYSVQMTDGKEIIRDFVPCYRKVDNEIGMYDLINDEFYINAKTVNTESFKKGSDI